MQTHRPTRGITAAVLSLVATAVLGVGSVAAHSQTIDPNGEGAGFTKPISNRGPGPLPRGGAGGRVRGVERSRRLQPALGAAVPGNVTNPGGQVTGP